MTASSPPRQLIFNYFSILQTGTAGRFRSRPNRQLFFNYFSILTQAGSARPGHRNCLCRPTPRPHQGRASPAQSELCCQAGRCHMSRAGTRPRSHKAAPSKPHGAGPEPSWNKPAKRHCQTEDRTRQPIRGELHCVRVRGRMSPKQKGRGPTKPQPPYLPKSLEPHSKHP